MRVYVPFVFVYTPYIDLGVVRFFALFSGCAPNRTKPPPHVIVVIVYAATLALAGAHKSTFATIVYLPRNRAIVIGIIIVVIVIIHSPPPIVAQVDADCTI